MLPAKQRSAGKTSAGAVAIGVAGALKGQVPLGFLVLEAGVARPAAEVEHKAGVAAPSPEPRRFTEADEEVMQNLVARLRRVIRHEIEEANTAEPPE